MGGFMCEILESCAHEERPLTGKVVDESGNGIGRVAVRACYTGWGWSNGGLVWDKPHCSETVLTDSYRSSL